MGKLLQLLNEFYPVDWWDKEYHIEDSMVYVRDYDDDDIFNYEIFTLNVISKKFWFIERLIENDKIDIDKTLKEYWMFRYIYFNAWIKLSDRFIMYLSIQDDPISFLVSILK